MDTIPDPDHASVPEGWGYDLLLYGNEQIIRSSDTGTLVAFGAIAFQELRGKGLPHQEFGCGILLFSVLFCVLVHFAVGTASVGRARTIIRGTRESRSYRLFRVSNQILAWVATAIQFVMILLGIVLVLMATPPRSCRSTCSNCSEGSHSSSIPARDFWYRSTICCWTLGGTGS